MRPFALFRLWSARLVLARLLLAALALGAVRPAAAQSAPPPLTPQQAQQALEVLRDPQRRAEMLSVLEAVARAAPPARRPGAPAAQAAAPAAPVEETGTGESRPASAPPPAAPAAPPATPPQAAPPPAVPPAPLAPDSIGAQVIVGVSERLATLADDVMEMVRTVTSFPLIVLWLMQLASDPARQGLLLDTVWRLAAVMGTGLAAEWLVARLLRPLRGRLANRAPAEPAALPADDVAAAPAAASATSRLEQEVRQSDRIWRRARRLGFWLRRVPFGLAALAIDLVPMLAVLATGYAMIGSGLAQQPTPRLVILAALNAYVMYRLASGVACMLVAPAEPRLRLLPVGDAMASYVCLWARRIAAVGIFGFATIEAGLLFGLYRLAHGALVKLLILVLAGFVVVIILQQRHAIAAQIRPAEGATGMAARIRAVVAPVWHIVAAVYVAALWVILALDLPDGFLRLLRLSLATAAVLVAARLAMILALGAMHRLMQPAVVPNVGGNGMAGRLVTYQPMLRAVLRMAIGIAAVLGLLQVWGIPALSWLLQAELGGRLMRMLGSIAVTVTLAVGVWEMVNLAIERHLAGLAASAQVARSARLRTLLPMFRTALLVAILVVVVLTILSEIGLNIAPLLAGAGVFGVALAFGSQRLVQDVITGLFLLLENTMQVGDVVTLGGMSGTVENLSIRTIRLRAMDGSMHIVPFSAVTTVTNQTRDFGYAVVDVSVGLSEDPDRIGDILRDVAAEMRREDRWATAISADLEVLGIDRFIDNALVLRTRMRTTPSQRWAVGRELNRRIKQRFDALEIASPMSAPRPPAHALEEASG